MAALTRRSEVAAYAVVDCRGYRKDVPWCWHAFCGLGIWWHLPACYTHTFRKPSVPATAMTSVASVYAILAM